MAQASMLTSDNVVVTGQWTFSTAPTFSSGATINTGAVLVNPSITGAVVTGTVTIATGASLVNPSITGATLTGTFTGSHTINTGATIINPSITGAVITGTVTIASGATLTTPSISGATITGIVTVATGASITNALLTGATTIGSGATMTYPTVFFPAFDVSAAGTDATGAAQLAGVVPLMVTSTGASGAGVALPTSGAASTGAFVMIRNYATGDLKIYAPGKLINGVTGTTAKVLAASGTATCFYTPAAQWSIGIGT